MASDVTIVNRALTLLGENNTITSFADDKEAARLATRDFAQVRDELIQEHPWNFSTQQTTLAVNATAPTHTYARAFDLPNDCLQVDGVVNAYNRPWKVIGRQIFTDIEAPLGITYRKRITDANLMPPAFREALAAKLAWDWALIITGSRSIQKDRGSYYALKLQQARTADGQEGTLDPLDTSTWLDARV